jgi:hypothetical protein
MVTRGSDQPRSDCAVTETEDSIEVRHRSSIECGINRLTRKRHRGVATGYDRLAVRYQAVLTMTLISG